MQVRRSLGCLLWLVAARAWGAPTNGTITGVVSADGSYRIADVPPGSYTLVAWSPAHEPVKRTIQVTAGATVKASFTLKRRETKPHLNKSGEQYGRYH